MIYRFGRCELDTELNELRRDGERVLVEPMVYDLIVYMLENRDRLIDKDELNREIWDGRAVTDAALSTCLKQARQAIGNNGRRQDFIRTVLRRGFRFVGDVDNDGGDDRDGNARLRPASGLAGSRPRAVAGDLHRGRRVVVAATA